MDITYTKNHKGWTDMEHQCFINLLNFGEFFINLFYLFEMMRKVNILHFVFHSYLPPCWMEADVAKVGSALGVQGPVPLLQSWTGARFFQSK